MQPDTIQALSAKLPNLEKIDTVIQELEDRQKWLLQYIDLKKTEMETARLQSNLKFVDLVKRIDKVIEYLEERRGAMVESRDRIYGCTDGLARLEDEKIATQRVIGELERVEILKEAIGRVEMGLFDKRHFGQAAEAIRIIGSLKEGLESSKHAAVWLQKATVTIPLVQKAATDSVKAMLSVDSSRVDERMLKEAGQVIESDPDGVQRIVDWLAMFYLAGYEEVYCDPTRTEPDLTRLCSLDSRLNWLSRVLANLDTIPFPQTWRVHKAVVERFGVLTRKALNRAIELEHALDPQRLPQNLKAAVKNVASYEWQLQASRPQAVDNHPSFFFLMPAFEAHLHVFIDAHERRLVAFTRALITQAQKDFNKKKRSTSQFTAIPHDDRYVAQSADELTRMFKDGMGEVSRMTTGALLGGLAEIFQTALKEYCGYIMIEVQRIHGKRYTCY
jgi:hypothetical protein